VDVEADFRVFYHLTPADVVRLSGPHFLALAWRLSAYQGVVAARASAEEENGTAPAHREPGGRVESSAQAIRSDPALADVIDYG
jgi:hypothetical protein